MDDNETEQVDPDEEFELINRKDAALLLKVNTRTVVRMEIDGYLTPIKKGEGDKAPIFYRADEVEELRVSRRQGADGHKSDTPIEAMVNDAAVNMAMAPSSIIRSFAKSMEIAQDHTVKLMTPVSAAMEMNMQMLMKENRRLTDRCTKLENEIFEFIDMQKKAMRDDQEAKLVEITELEHLKMKKETFDRVTGYMPLIATLIGDKLNPSQKVKIRESAMVDIIDKMSIEQIESLQNSGAFGQPEMATIISMKQRLEKERADRLDKEAESAQDAENIKDDKN